jgi:cell division protein FtsI (penicillin-binding protein 3)
VTTGTVQRRLGLLHISLFFVFWLTLICGRLVWLQVIHYKDFVDRAARQQQRTFEVAPRRGVLYDRNLHELAMTVLADSVYAVPSEIADRQDPDGDAKRQAVANALAKVLHTDPTDRFTTAHQIAARLNASRNCARKSAESQRRVCAKGIQTLLSQQPTGSSGAGIRGHR